MVRVGQASGPATPVVYTRTIAGGLSIPDANMAGVTDTLTITDDFEIADLNFRVDSLRHPFVGELSVMLKAPNGYGTDLIFLPSISSGANFVNTVIDDSAPADLNVTTTPAPFTGSFVPAFNSSITRA